MSFFERLRAVTGTVGQTLRAGPAAMVAVGRTLRSGQTTLMQVGGLALVGIGLGQLYGGPAALVVVGLLLYVPATLSDFVTPRGGD